MFPSRDLEGCPRSAAAVSRAARLLVPGVVFVSAVVRRELASAQTCDIDVTPAVGR
jgi:hypothetical protein